MITTIIEVDSIPFLQQTQHSLSCVTTEEK
jgi:hypothetical protein